MHLLMFRFNYAQNVNFIAEYDCAKCHVLGVKLQHYHKFVSEGHHVVYLR